MELLKAVQALAALAQSSRLEVFRFLVASDAPVSAGEIAREFEIPKNTLSFHLKELTQAGLISSERNGRSICYQADVEGVRQLIGYLTEDCCQGKPELCVPDALEQCCGEKKELKQ